MDIKIRFSFFLLIQTAIFVQVLRGRDLEYPLPSSSVQRDDIVVAKDGSGNYTTVSKAVNAVARRPRGQRRIYVKTGIYKENIVITANDTILVGDGIGKTIITGSKSNDGSGDSIMVSGTVVVTGYRFICKYITIRNTAGPQYHQAVAVRSDSDQSVFYKCSIEGYQDTLYARFGRQFYRECDIYGTVDFICGDAAAVFQKCNIYLRNPPSKTNVITAQQQDNLHHKTGFSIQNSTVKAASDLRGASGVKNFLGRPWMSYSRTVFMGTYLDSLIDPAGWMEWEGAEPGRSSTLYYGEYKNTGPGSSTAKRVKWKGHRVIKSPAEAYQFTVQKLIDGDSWLRGTGVPYMSGL